MSNTNHPAPPPLTIEQEREAVRDNVALAFVNGKIPYNQAAAALTALESHWTETENER